MSVYEECNRLSTELKLLFLLYLGVARGCGWQHIGSLVNLAAFYLVGIPVAAVLGFWMQMRGRGLWIGVMCGALTQCALLAIVTGRTNWKEEVRLFYTYFSLSVA